MRVQINLNLINLAYITLQIKYNFKKCNISFLFFQVTGHLNKKANRKNTSTVAVIVSDIVSHECFEICYLISTQF